MKSFPNTRFRLATLAIPLAILCLGVLSSGCGGPSSAEIATQARERDPAAAEDRGGEVEWFVPPRPIPGLHQRLVGHGVEGSVLLWNKAAPPPRDAVVFLHSWKGLPPWFYGPWLRHIASHGNTVIYPVGQGLGLRPEPVVENMLAGIGAGLRAVHARSDSVVVIGHVTGGAVAFDYGALARRHGLPSPRGIFAVYPTARVPGGAVQTADLSAIPPSTRLEVIAGAADPLPGGDRQARAFLDGAEQVPPRLRTFVPAPYRKSPGPFPQSSTPRRSFWASADRMIAEARSGR